MVHPDVPGILLTPICTQSLSFRPIIFPDRYGLGLRLVELDVNACMHSFMHTSIYG